MPRSRFVSIAIGLLALAPRASAAQDEFRVVSLGRNATPVGVGSDVELQIA